MTQILNLFDILETLEVILKKKDGINIFNKIIQVIDFHLNISFQSINLSDYSQHNSNWIEEKNRLEEKIRHLQQILTDDTSIPKESDILRQHDMLSLDIISLFKNDSDILYSNYSYCNENNSFKAYIIAYKPNSKYQNINNRIRCLNNGIAILWVDPKNDSYVYDSNEVSVCLHIN